MCAVHYCLINTLEFFLKKFIRPLNLRNLTLTTHRAHVPFIIATRRLAFSGEKAAGKTTKRLLKNRSCEILHQSADGRTVSGCLQGFNVTL